MGHYQFEIWLIILSFVLLLPRTRPVKLNVASEYYRQNETPIAQRFLIFIFLFLGLLIILRDENIGNDTIEYVRSFNRYRIWDFNNRFEPGYNLLQSVTKILSNNKFAILMSCGTITILLFYNFIKRYSKYYFLSIVFFVFLGFWGQSMNIIRQTLACAIIAYSYSFLISNKLFKFIVSVLIASTFHSTAILFLSAWFIKSIKLTTRNILYALIGVIALYASFSTVLQYTFMINDSYEGYSNSIFGEGNRTGALFQASCYVGLVIFALIIRNRAGVQTFRDNGLDTPFILCFIGAAILFMSYNMSIFGRIAQYFNIFQLILLPNAIRLLKVKQQYVVTSLLFIYVNLFFWITQILRPDWNRIFPYQTFL